MQVAQIAPPCRVKLRELGELLRITSYRLLVRARFQGEKDQSCCINLDFAARFS
jgi:hypothetical protein